MWIDLVAKISAGDPVSMEYLYGTMRTRLRPYVGRRIGYHDADDRLHDIYIITVNAIRSGDLRDPRCLFGFIAGVARNQCVEHVKACVRRRQQEDVGSMDLRDCKYDPEQAAIEGERFEHAMRVLRAIPKRDRDVLDRFYLQDQSPGHICLEMNLTPNQFKNIKHRAKRIFTEMSKQAAKKKRPLSRPPVAAEGNVRAKPQRQRQHGT